MMKRLFLTLIVCLAALSGAYSQDYVPTPVKVSTEKVSFSGKVYWSHKVLEKQTLYSIAKAYSVPVDAIVEANPTLANGLKSGTIIFIPCDKVEKPAAQESDAKSGPDSSGGSFFAPRGQSTLPNSSTQETIEVPYGYTLHTVRWFENLSSIAAKYGVSEQAIIEVNGLSESKVHRRQKLLIPPKDYIPKAFRNESDSNSQSITVKPEVSVEDSLLNAPLESLSEQEMVDRLHHIARFHRYTQFKPARIAVILPINSTTSDPSQNFIDFYCGTLLALEDLKENGINAEVTFWDSGSYKVKSLIADGKLKGSDLIIGPVMEKDVAQMAAYCDSVHIPFVSPLDQKAASLVGRSRYMYQVPPSDNVRIANTVESMKVSYRDKVTLIYEKGGKDTALVRMYREALNSQNIKFQSFSYDILQGRSIRSKLEGMMSRSYTQKVVVASENEAFVQDCLRNLNLLIDFGHYDLQAWGQPKWRNYETLDPTYCHKACLHMSMPYNVDYSNDKVKSFVIRYRDLYNAEPTPFAFQGYDIACYFISALNDMGGDLGNYIEFYPKSMLQSEMKFRRDGRRGGFINSATKNVVFKPDYSIE